MSFTFQAIIANDNQSPKKDKDCPKGKKLGLGSKRPGSSLSGFSQYVPLVKSLTFLVSSS